MRGNPLTAGKDRPDSPSPVENRKMPKLRTAGKLASLSYRKGTSGLEPGRSPGCRDGDNP